MKREFLTNMGLEKEQVDNIMAEHGKSVNDLKEKAEKNDTLESQISDYKQQLEDRDTQLKELGEKAKGNDDLTSQIEELKQQNETTKTEYEQKLHQQSFDHTLENSLSGAKVKNTKAIKALLDMDTIKLDGDSLKGLDDQLNNIKESDPYLFEEEESTEPPKPSFTTGQHASSGKEDSFVQQLFNK